MKKCFQHCLDISDTISLSIHNGGFTRACLQQLQSQRVSHSHSKSHPHLQLEVRIFLTVISSDQHLNPALQNITIPFDKALPALIEFFHDRSFVNLSTAEKGMCLPALVLILRIEQSLL